MQADASSVIKTPIPGLTVYEGVIPHEMHDKFVKQMDNGKPEQNFGHFDGYDFDDYTAFDAVFYPLVERIFDTFRKHSILTDKKMSAVKLGCTLVGYKKDGFITRHIDSPLRGGDTVVVVSFNSPVVINFYSEKGDKAHHKILIQPRTMYVMKDEARHKWSHAILADEDEYKGEKFGRIHRYAMLLFPPPPSPLYTGEILTYNPAKSDKVTR